MVRHTKKGKRFEMLISRADLALKLEFYLEASWILYSLLEERLKSLSISKLKLTMNRENFCECLESLALERKKNIIIEENLSEELLIKLNNWRLERNKIMHDLAKEDIDYNKVVIMAKEGRVLFADLTKALIKIKKSLK